MAPSVKELFAIMGFGYTVKTQILAGTRRPKSWQSVRTGVETVVKSVPVLIN